MRPTSVMAIVFCLGSITVCRYLTSRRMHCFAVTSASSARCLRDMASTPFSLPLLPIMWDMGRSWAIPTDPKVNSSRRLREATRIFIRITSVFAGIRVRWFLLLGEGGWWSISYYVRNKSPLLHTFSFIHLLPLCPSVVDKLV